MQDTSSQFKKFIIDNRIIGTSAGVCIALAAKDSIQSIVNDIIIPLILIFIQRFGFTFLKDYLPKSEKSVLDITEFIKNMVTFILVVCVSFLFIKLAFEYLLNIKQNDDDLSKPNIL